MVDLDLIRRRKEIYGDNVAFVAEAISRILGVEVSPQKFCEMMAELKRARISAIKKRWADVRDERTPTLAELEALADSETDRDNYEWIAQNYEEYKRL